MTKFIFDFLKNNSDGQVVLHGNFGIGKTISFIFYAKLSAIIHEYIEECNDKLEETAILYKLIENK